MNNQLFGILIVIFCFIGYFYSWKHQIKDNYKIAVILLMLSGLTLRIYISADFFLHNWDERYHALVAKNLMKHPFIPTLYDSPVLPYDFKCWVANHIWLHKQPLPLWTMAASMQLFGINEISIRIPSIILTTAGIYLTFYISSYFFNKKVGFLSAFFYSINGIIIELTGGRVATDHIDIFFLFYIEFAIFFSILFVQKKKSIFNIFAGISIGVAILSKWLPALIVLPVWLLIIIDSRNFSIKSIIFHFFILTLTCTLVFLPWQIYIFNAFPIEAEWEASFNYKHLIQVLEGRGGAFYYFIDKIRVNYGELIYLPLLWFFYKYFIDFRNLKRLTISIWILIPVLFFSFSKTKMQGYILFTSPALFIITAEFWYMLFDYRKNHKLKWLFNIILFLIIALPIRYSIERIKPFDNYERDPQWVKNLRNLNSENFRQGILLNYNKPIEAMFYTKLIAYSELPGKNIITKLISQGYTVIINDDGKIPKEIKSIQGVNYVNLEAL